MWHFRWNVQMESINYYTHLTTLATTLKQAGLLPDPVYWKRFTRTWIWMQVLPHKCPAGSPPRPALHRSPWSFGCALFGEKASPTWRAITSSLARVVRERLCFDRQLRNPITSDPSGMPRLIYRLWKKKQAWGSGPVFQPPGWAALLGGRSGLPPRTKHECMEQGRDRRALGSSGLGTVGVFISLKYNTSLLIIVWLGF